MQPQTMHGKLGLQFTVKMPTVQTRIKSRQMRVIVLANNLCLSQFEVRLLKGFRCSLGYFAICRFVEIK